MLFKRGGDLLRGGAGKDEDNKRVRVAVLGIEGTRHESVRELRARPPLLLEGKSGGENGKAAVDLRVAALSNRVTVAPAVVTPAAGLSAQLGKSRDNVVRSRLASTGHEVLQRAAASAGADGCVAVGGLHRGGPDTALGGGFAAKGAVLYTR